MKCYKTGSIIQWVKVWDLGSDNPSFKFWLYTYSLRNPGQVIYPSVSQLLICKMEIIVPILWDYCNDLIEIMYISTQLMIAMCAVCLLNTHDGSQNQEPDMGTAETKNRATDFTF